MRVVREHIFEKFVEDSDPIIDMNIGLKHLIAEWVEKINDTIYRHARNKIASYAVNDDGSIDVGVPISEEKTINLLNLQMGMPEAIAIRGNIEKLPDFINFNICYGDCFLNVSELVTLRGCPRIVYGHFCINHNPNLDSLEYFPDIVLGNVYTHQCKRLFKEEEIRKLCRIEGNVTTIQ